ncbi:unnamed protein product [Spirodela intermedia]|uniref:Uncharacterized protein n=1 Tax=Spirodela intermedia TaxID=51605 RepID=A0A7I8JDM5_SPIIN|nr:unnamed protein product [Spirodela intermedia]CAA6668256.1 unnamed protein product [Spirodela intermedia]
MDLDDDDSQEVAEVENDIENGDEAMWDQRVEGDGRDGEGDGPDEYHFQFEGGMDPLDVVEADAIEVEPYRLFERLEYEALAEKKRKSLLQKCSDSMKRPRQEDAFGANFDDILETMNHSFRKKSRQHKKRGRRKGSKKRLSPEVTRKLGDATLYYASGCYDKAIHLLKDVLQIAPNLSDVYHTLGLIYSAMGDRKKALTYYMFAAHMAPKDPSLWKLLVAWSIEQGNTGQARHCLRKAIKADPQDIGLKFDYASLYIEVGEYQEAWKSLEEIVKHYPDDFEAQIKVSKIYHECGQVSRATEVLEACINKHSSEADLNAFSLLIILLMKNNSHGKALQYIEQAKSIFYPEKELPLHLTVKTGICLLYLGDIENAKVHFQCLLKGTTEYASNLISEVAHSFSNVGLHDSALGYYSMLEEISSDEKVGKLHSSRSPLQFCSRWCSEMEKQKRKYRLKPNFSFSGPLLLKIGHCYLSLNEREKAIPFFHKALSLMEDDIDARVVLSSLLIEEGKTDEAIIVLSPSGNSEVITTASSNTVEPGHWSLNGRIRLQLAKIYHGRGMLLEFADAILNCIRETLFIEAMNEKVKSKKRLSMSALLERAKLLHEHEDDSVFRGFRPIAKTADLNKASRARKLLREKEKKKEAGNLEWQIEESEDESPLCKALVSLHRYWDALEIIKMLLYSTISTEKKEELRSIGAQIAHATTDPKHGYDCVRDFVQQHPYSSAAWNCYYKVASRLEYPYAKHLKFLHEMRETRKDCLPPILITGHQFAMVRYQSAAREYLQAYRLQPTMLFINLCVEQAPVCSSGIAFLNKYLSICQNSQEALYNVARAYHVVGHYTLERDHPIPRLPNESPTLPETVNPGYCNLHSEAAYNLHLIYKKSGAVDLARQVLKMYCRP